MDRIDKKIHKYIIFKRCALRLAVGITILALVLAGSAAITVNASSGGDYKNIQGSLNNASAGAKDIKLSAHGFDTSLKGGGDYHIVQFSGTIKEEWKKELEDRGARIIGYIPDNALLIKYHGVPAHPSIVRSGDFAPEYRVSPRLTNRNGKMTLNVIPFEKNDSLVSQISLLGGKVEPAGERLRVTIDASRIPDIASLEDVEWVEEYVPPRLLNDVSSGIIGTSTVWADPGLDGTGQIVAVDDTGLDTGDLATIHDDFKGRIKAHFGYGRPAIGTDSKQRKTWDDPDGHGTHVSGSVLGNGSHSGGAIKGMAYNATLVIQSILDSSNGLNGLNVGINQIYLDSFNQGSRIQSNSWGAAVSGAYDSFSVDVDTFAWDHKDFVILFSAGNEGRDSNSDGIVDLNSLSSPGTAKNVITVGASENYRSGFSTTYGNAWPLDFPANPISSDRLADNSSGMVAFSSRGPTNDGRIKPDVVAPGTWVLSTKSSLAPSANYWSIYDSYYAYNGGTSMSTPLTAGAAALVRQYYVNSSIAPSSALIKATLINTAKNMTGQYASPKKDVTGQPDNNQGWGRVDPGRLKEEKVFVDNITGINTGKFNETNVTVYGSRTFVATLVWTDYPGLAAAAKELVNDLDLIVTDPAGQQFYGNDFTVPYNSSYDSTNNVEGVIINNPVAGTYKVNVSARNVPMGPQPFALVISGIGENITVIANQTIYPNGQTAAKNGDTITLVATVNASKGVHNVTVNASAINSSLAKVVLEKSTGDLYINSSVIVNASGGVYKLNVTAYDNSSNMNNLTQLTVVVDNIAPFQMFINGTVIDSINKTGIAGVAVSANTSLSTITNVSGFYSFAVTSGTYDLSAKFEPMYYVNNTIMVSTTGSAVVLQDIELVRKLTGNITGIVNII
ncbi:MAG: S8 family serine peptidase [Candidatus Methanoperedens sp.]|nr:S8 family serine peptidase [Candidatus Methanoperedens sp.]